MAKGRKPKPTYETRIVEPDFQELEKEIQESRPIKKAWRTEVQVLKPLIHTYRISGKKNDIIDVPSDLVDELLAKKMIKCI